MKRVPILALLALALLGAAGAQLGSWVHAQEAPEQAPQVQEQEGTEERVAPAEPVTGPAAAADEAVRAWLTREPLNPVALAGVPPEELCRELPGLLENPPPPQGTTVNFGNRVERPAEDPSMRRYTYPVTFPGERLAVLEVTLQQEGETWTPTRVGLQQGAQTPSIPAFFQTPVASWGFVLLTLGLLYALARPSFLRRWLAEGWGYIKAHRRLVIGTVALLYGLFALGVFSGANLPPECQVAIAEFVERGVSGLGATEAYESGNVARAAVVTMYQNFVMGTLVTTYGVAFISFGVLAYLLNGARFLALGLPFGFLTQADPVTLLAVLILIVVELMAYVLVTAGGGMLLATLIRQGFGGFRLAFRKLTMMLPIAFLLLVVGAWYEAAIIILPALLGA